MNLKEFKILADKSGYLTEPLSYTGSEISLGSFADYQTADLELKIHWNVLVLCRSFYGTYTAYYKDVVWFLNNFFEEFQVDINRIELSGTIKEAAEMILRGGVFDKRIIGTQFMISILEYYVKYFLGFRPMLYDFFDKNGKSEYLNQYPQARGKKDIGLVLALEILQSLEKPISKSLSEIDQYRTKKLLYVGIESHRWIQYTIAQRLSLCRNSMMHGEFHNFYSIGDYVLMLYCLFHLHDQQENTK